MHACLAAPETGGIAGPVKGSGTAGQESAAERSQPVNLVTAFILPLFQFFAADRASRPAVMATEEETEHMIKKAQHPGFPVFPCFEERIRPVFSPC